MTEVEYVGNKVREFRTQADMTQDELARSIGVSRQTIIAIEKSNYTPSVLLALKLARTFNTSVENIFSYDKE